MADRGSDRRDVRNVGNEPQRQPHPDPAAPSAPTDAGKTSGGGSLGHDQPPEVEEQTHTRNRARDPVMPDEGSTLRTQI